MSEYDQLRGKWVAVSAERQGEPLPEWEVIKKRFSLEFDGERFTWRQEAPHKGRRGTITIDATQQPKAMAMVDTMGRKSTVGIYELKGDTLKVRLGQEQRPKAFQTHPDHFSFMMVMRREH